MRTALLSLLLAAPAIAQSFPVSEFKLDNGMTLLVQEDHSTPAVVMYTFYKVGSVNERPGLTGLSHFFEHMMFNGSKNFSPGEFDRVMENVGGNNNAFTDTDITAYQNWFPPAALNTIVDLEADRIAALSFDPEKIKSEREVVSRERSSSVDDDPQASLYEQFQAIAFMAHPYQFPVIGWPSDIRSWTLEDLKHHWSMGYSPSNATMIICGDVDTEAVVKLARKKLGSIPRRETPPPVKTIEPKQEGERRIVLRREVQASAVLMGWHRPETLHADNTPLEVLSTVLTNGDSSRLSATLVDAKPLLANVGVFNPDSLYPSLLVLSTELRDGVEPEDAIEAIDAELAKVVSTPITDAELVKAKRQMLSGYWQRMATIDGRAHALGEAAIFHGDYKKAFEYPKAIEAVTISDIQRVASEYMKPENRTIGILEPPANSSENAGASSDPNAPTEIPIRQPMPTSMPTAVTPATLPSTQLGASNPPPATMPTTQLETSDVPPATMPTTQPQIEVNK